MKKYTRRDFIEHTAKGTAGLIAYPIVNKSSAVLHGTTKSNSRVVVVKDDNAALGHKLDKSVIQTMMDEGIQKSSGINDVGEAWKSFFPGITQEKVIGIKINCIARQDNMSGLATHPEVVNCMVNGLTKMQVDGAPFPENNIIIWDRAEFEMTRAGYTINKGSTGVRCMGTRYEIMRNGRSSTGYSTEVSYKVNGVAQYLSNILVNKIDYLINANVLKNHVYSGVTLSLKNHYGTCWNPYAMHFRDCDPYIAALNNLDPIKNKQVLNVCDAIHAIYNNGPMGAPQAVTKTLIFSADPVAHDYTGLQMLKDLGCSTIYKSDHIYTAADQYNLGTYDPNNIDMITVENPSTEVDFKPNDIEQPIDFHLFQNYPNPFNAQTTISYQLNKPAKVRFDIFNIQGSLVRSLINEEQDTGHFQIIWDGISNKARSMPSGTYIARLQIFNKVQMIKMQLTK
jgi:uncharacterized protein (DUF362 family)